MLDDRAKDLINREIDGELSDSERARCMTLLGESEAAREYRAELSRLNELLAQVPSLELPEDLRRSIAAQIELPRPRKWFTHMAGWMQGRPVSHGIAAAAGLLVATAIYELAPGQKGVPDYSSLVGTLARGIELGTVDQLGSLVLEHEAVDGRVIFSGNDALKLLRFEVNSGSQVEIEVDLAGSGLAFGGFAQEGESVPGQVVYEQAGRVKVASIGQRRFTLVLRDDGRAAEHAGGIAVSVSQEGENLFQDILTRQ